MRRGICRRAEGFTLLELMVVVAILAVLATAAFVNFQRSRIAANEARVINALHVVSAAQAAFHTSNQRFANLAELNEPDPPYITSELASGTKYGYRFEVTDFGEYRFACEATPLNPGRTGVQSFCVDETGVIRAGDCGTGTPVGN